MQVLRKDLKPTRVQGTRWSSKRNLVEKESVLRPVYKSMEIWPETVQRYMPASVEETRLDELLLAVSIFESVSKTTQGEGTQRKTLSGVRKVFDGLAEDFDSYPTRGLRLHLQHWHCEQPRL